MPKPKKRHVTYRLAVFLLFLLSPFPFNVEGSQSPSQDVVVLIDCSDSASPYLPSIAQIMSRFVAGARSGDSFACYQFSTNAALIASGGINTTSNIEQLKSQMRQLSACGPYTSYFPALERGLADMRASRIARPGAERLMMLITDGRRHPGDTRSESATLQELLTRYSDLDASKDFSFYCFSIGNWLERDLQSYLLAAGAYLVYWPESKERLDRLTLAEATISDRVSHIGQIPDTPSHGSFSVNFITRRPPQELTMIEIGVKTDFTKGTLDRLFDVKPRRIQCRQQPWTEKYGLETRGFSRGEYSGVFVFQPSEPETLLLSPRRLAFDFSVAESLRVNVFSPLIFGPTGFRGAYEETLNISITPSGTDFPASLDAISVLPDIHLPEGLELNVTPSLKGKEISVAVTVTIRSPLAKSSRGKYEGALKLVSPGGWAVTQSEIPLTVEVAGRGVNMRAIAFYSGVALACLTVVVAFLAASRKTRTALSDFRTHKVRPSGKLIVTKDPTGGMAKDINLARISEKQGTKEVFVGAGEEMDVELPHSSTIDKAYRFTGLKTRDDAHTIVEAIKGSEEVLVNNKSRTGRVQLMHLDSLKFGAFEFRFETPKPLHQVVLYFLDSEVKQGWRLTWDTKTEGFRFLDRADLPSRKELYVRFYELKAAAFVRDFAGELTWDVLSLKIPRRGHLVRIIFADGEEITGYVFDWKNPGEKFYFFPDAMGTNILFFLIERNTLKEIVLLKEDPGGAKRAQHEFAGVLERMQRESGIS